MSVSQGGAITIRNPLYRPSAVKKFIKGKSRTGGFYRRYKGKGAELKFFDTALSFSFDATGEVPATGQLSLIPQGVTESTRVGRKCVIKSIQIRGTAFNNDATVSDTDAYIYIVQDTQCNGAAAAVTDVLTSNNMGTALVNLENSERFRILRRIPLHLQTGAGVAAAFGDMSKQVNLYMKCNIPLEFDSSASTGAIGTIRSNNVFLLAGTSGTDDKTAFAGTCRLRFSDM